MICPKCRGAGTVEIVLGKKATVYDDWSFRYDGWKYRVKICKRCMGTGEI
jgi:hypothetical protein